jgi:DNA-binding CsgD family transcriptional regulator/tetratricopeptide (TPR) repeat protein
MPRAEGDGRRIALVGGEAGSGKSRLVREFAREAAGGGALVLYGACDAVVKTPYRPFVEALDQLVRASDLDGLVADLGPGGGELVRLLPDLGERAPELAPPTTGEPDTERHRLHTAVSDFLAAAGQRDPVLLVVEDGHWADVSTLLLLRHLARSSEARMLLLATFRDTDADVPEELSEALVDLRRSEDVTRIRLAGLPRDDITDFVRRAAGGDLGPELPELARAIEELTEGNPFLMTELWRSIVENAALSVEGGQVRLARPLEELGSPESVREVVSQRLSRLAPATTEVLEVAAVVGPAFELGVAERASTRDRAALVAALDEAVRSGMIEEVSSLGLSYRFTHELVRRAVLERLTALRRAELHLRVGEAIEHVSANDTDRVVADLAHHFASAAALGDVPRAVEYNLRAARAAESSLAFDQAAALLRTAIDLGRSSPLERALLQLELGTASNRAGKTPAALAAFRETADIARELGDSELLAHAAIGLENACWRPGIADEGALELLEEAATSFGNGDSELRIMLLAGLFRALAFRGDQDRAALVLDDVIAMARRVGDRRALATVLMRSYWVQATRARGEAVGMLSESAEIAAALGDLEIQAEAIEWRIAAYMAVGDLGSVRSDLATVFALAATTGQPFILHVAEHDAAAIALCDGRLGEAEAAAERSREWGRLMAGRDSSGVYGIQMFGIRREQGRLAELAPVVGLLAGTEYETGAWGPGLAALQAELGMDHEARRELARFRTEGLESLRESLWLASLSYLTDAAAAVEDEAVAEIVYPEFAVQLDPNVVIGHGVACYGSRDRYLGMLASTLGEWDRAERHFEAALELNRIMVAGTWVAHTAYEYGRMLLRRNRRGASKHTASLLLGEADRLARQIGMASLRARVRALGSVSGPTARAPDGLSAREVEVLRLLAQGLSNREIGKELFISEHTAANHVRSILRKTASGNRTEAASYAHRRGLAAGYRIR